MRRSFLSAVVFAFLPLFATAAPLTPARLLSAYWLDGSANLDISGLSFCAGELLAVSDKDSTQVYRLLLGRESAALKPYRQLAGLAAPADENLVSGFYAKLANFARGAGAMDFEGITCDAENLYLVSEHYNRIAVITPSGARWLPRQYAKAAQDKGYLQQFNAASEGLVKIGGDFWVALERNPRGLAVMRADSAGEPELLSLPAVPALDFRGRSVDLTGLAYYGGALFTLERNAFAVCRRSLQDLSADWCIDYRAIEEAPEFVYQETRFGKGEGLAVDSSGIYVLLDNNGVGRAADSADKRALLLHLAFPGSAEPQLGSRAAGPLLKR